MDDVATENRILKQKILEMESQINSLSTNMATDFDRRGSQMASPKEREMQNLNELRQVFEEKLQQIQYENNEKEKYFLSLKENQE